MSGHSKRIGALLCEQSLITGISITIYHTTLHVFATMLHIGRALFALVACLLGMSRPWMEGSYGMHMQLSFGSSS